MNKHTPAYIILMLLVFYIGFGEFGYQMVHKDKLTPLVETTDTTYQEQNKAFNLSIPEPKVIVLDNTEKWKEELTKTFGKLTVENQLLSKLNDSLVSSLNLYSDTLSDENLEVYYNSLVHGDLLSSNMSYKLKVPKTITKTKLQPIPTKQNLWLLKGGVGGNKNTFNNLSLGVQSVFKKGFSTEYQYNFLQNTHHVGVGLTLNRR